MISLASFNCGPRSLVPPYVPSVLLSTSDIQRHTTRLLTAPYTTHTTRSRQADLRAGIALRGLEMSRLLCLTLKQHTKCHYHSSHASEDHT
eukprot:3542154-Rhodomonas_salina.2